MPDHRDFDWTFMGRWLDDAIDSEDR